MKRIFHEIRHTLGSYASTNCEVQLMDTLEALDQLEADFAALCREVASLSIDHNTKKFTLSSEFDQMAERRGIELPEIL